MYEGILQWPCSERFDLTQRPYTMQNGIGDGFIPTIGEEYLSTNGNKTGEGEIGKTNILTTKDTKDHK